MKLNTLESYAGNRAIAERVARLAEAMGYKASINQSGLSASVYLTLRRAGAELKVRIANHTARPSYEALYGEADIEIGNHEHACTWDAAIEQLAHRAGVAVPVVVARVRKAAETRKRKLEESVRSKLDQARAALRQRIVTALETGQYTVLRVSKRRTVISDNHGEMAAWQHEYRLAQCRLEWVRGAASSAPADVLAACAEYLR